jgi:hypothetical protein
VTKYVVRKSLLLFTFPHVASFESPISCRCSPLYWGQSASWSQAPRYFFMKALQWEAFPVRPCWEGCSSSLFFIMGEYILLRSYEQRILVLIHSSLFLYSAGQSVGHHWGRFTCELFLLEAGSWGRKECRNREEGECQLLETATKQW